MKPTYRVFPNKKTCFADIQELFVDGFPSNRISIGLNPETTEQGLEFTIDLNACNDKQKRNLIHLAMRTHNCSYEQVLIQGVFLESKYIDHIENADGKKVTMEQLNTLKDSLNNVLTQTGITIELDGSSLHCLILGLQLGLNHPYWSNSDITMEVLEVTCQLIINITQDKKELKDFYLQGFPEQYQCIAQNFLYNWV